MSVFVLRLRENIPPITIAWRGPDHRLIAVAQRGEYDAIAAVVGPPGPEGPSGSVGDPGDISISFENGLI